MESNTNIDPNERFEHEVNGDAFDDVEEIDANEANEVDAAEAGDRPRGRGRGRGHRGPGGRRPFGPNRPYRFALFVEEDGSFVLRSPDLSERSATIASLEELGATMQAAIDERTAEDAAAAAEAAKDADYSGKFVLRLPKSMHRQLSELAESEGVSLNQLALAFLAEGMGKAELTEDFGKRRGHRGGPRGGRGPKGHGPGGRGPWEHGPRGGRDRGPDEHGPEREFGGRADWKDRGHRGRHGGGPEGRGPERHGFRRPRWFMNETPESKVDSPEPTEMSFV